eukprot:280415-Chlamydomonas_euryale.AAC.1
MHMHRHMPGLLGSSAHARKVCAEAHRLACTMTRLLFSVVQNGPYPPSRRSFWGGGEYSSVPNER